MSWYRAAMAAIVLSYLGFADEGAAQTPKYAGRTVTVLVNFTPGGSTDIEARLIAKHLGRFIPGEPTVIVQNMAGAGGAIAVNWLGQVAKPDGLLLAYLKGITSKGALKSNDLRVDLRNLAFVAASPGINIAFVRADTPPGITTARDILKASGFWVGGLNPDSNKDVRMRLQLDLLALNYKYISGYKGSAEARLALQQNEIQLYVEALTTYRTTIEPSLVATKLIVPLWYDSLFKGAVSYRSSATEGIDAVPFDEFLRGTLGRDPSGLIWDAYRLVTQFSTDFLSVLMMAPGTPSDAVGTMRSAIEQLDKDEKFKAEARTSLGTSIEFASGPQTEKAFLGMLDVDPKVHAFLDDYIKKGFAQSGK